MDWSLRGISLANKCLLLFGGAVVLIVVLALTAPWLRMHAIGQREQMARHRALLDLWLDTGSPDMLPGAGSGTTARFMSWDELDALTDGRLQRQRASAGAGPFEADLHAQLNGSPRLVHVRRLGTGERERYAVLMLPPGDLAWQSAVNTIYLFSAAVFVLGLAVLVFYLITHRIVLGPVRELRATAERVRGGDISVRSAIVTGDEFQELSETFNAMLSALERSTAQLRAQNSALDSRVAELAERNTALHEANRLKGEFLASVSHELRTPMNSIIGFGELLRDIAQNEQRSSGGSESLSRRLRYINHIVDAARSLLDMINSLLQMAKIEAGKFDLSVEPVVLADLCEALLGLIHPLAQRRNVTTKLELAPGLPLVHTDRAKIQQILFNFLSNAVKFTGSDPARPAPPTVVLRAEPLPSAGPAQERVRISVIDNGPGIAPADQQRIFEKFTQLDSSHTREQGGTGLGLAICKELAGMLGGTIQLVSDVGRGAMFSLVLPVRATHTQQNTTHRADSTPAATAASPS